MRKLYLDFNIQRRRTAWPAWLLLLAGLALWGEMGYSYFQLQQEMNSLESMQLKNGNATKAVAQKSVASYTPAELAHAQEIIARIAIPWNDLFQAVETVKVEHVALLGLEPDAKTGRVLLRGEAGDLPALLTYIARLRQTSKLSEVYLMRHEINPANNPQRPVAFSISAYWGVGA
ncbi:MAG: hypothetical protein Q7S51_01410 [Gallionellaceae bacterium]|nr:hypothetical protein [Gallionellaceae bacterium]